jgi:methyl-accepting chemotaxis protein
VENLRAHVALDARLANLLQLTAGADVGIDKVKLTIKGVKAEVLLKVRLDNVAKIIDRTLTTIDKNPQILERLLTSVDNTVSTVGSVANSALQPGGVLSQTVNTLGQTVQRTLDTTGNLVEKTLDTTGKIVNQRTIGSVLDTAATGLRVVNETTNNAGQTVRRLQDSTGGIIEVTLDSAGKIVNSRIVQGATNTQPR